MKDTDDFQDLNGKCMFNISVNNVLVIFECQLHFPDLIDKCVSKI